jgi:hypothetical protein
MYLTGWWDFLNRYHCRSGLARDGTRREPKTPNLVELENRVCRLRLLRSQNHPE